VTDPRSSEKTGTTKIRSQWMAERACQTAEDAESRDVPGRKERWSLAELIDFETAMASWDGKVTRRRADASARAAVIKEWLEAREVEGPGKRWVSAMGLAAMLLGLVAGVAGAGAVWGTLDRQTGGVNVIWLMAVTLWVPWALMLLGGIGWLFRGRLPGIGLLGKAVEHLSMKFVGPEVRDGLERVRRSGELGRVVGWHVAKLSQRVAADFHGGAFVGLGAMVLFKQVGFFWETTTQRAMEGALEKGVEVMALPWSWQLGLPDVAGSRSSGDWMETGLGWWPFLLMALLIWGVLPRVILSIWAGGKERSLLQNLAFQAPHHRKLWRGLTEVRRGEEPKGPVDGALVISVGSGHPDHDALRPFLLRRLRMNPTAWESIAVLDADREDAARDALAKSPAGIVLLAEGWSLAPRQMERALAEVATRAEGRRIVLLVGNPSTEGMEPVTDEERAQWERFVDERKAEELELIFYEAS